MIMRIFIIFGIGIKLSNLLSAIGGNCRIYYLLWSIHITQINIRNGWYLWKRDGILLIDKYELELSSNLISLMTNEPIFVRLTFKSLNKHENENCISKANTPALFICLDLSNANQEI